MVHKATRVEDAPIPQEWKDAHKGEWAVHEGAIVYDYYKTQEEAEKEARLINKVTKVVEDIEDCADEHLGELTEEERSFLRRFYGEKIEIEI